MPGSIGCHRTARLAEQRHRAARPDHIEAFQKRGRADRIVNHIDAFAVRESFDFGGEIFARVNDHFVRARFLRDGGFLVSARRAVDGRAQHLRHLHDQSSRAARRRMHQRLVARLQRKRRVRQIVRRHALQHRGRAVFRSDVIRQRHQLRRRHQRVLRIRAARHRVSHAVARFDVR